MYWQRRVKPTSASGHSCPLCSAHRPPHALRHAVRLKSFLARMPGQLRIEELFDKAELLAKEVELFQCGVSTPAINQLRYAGPHVLKALVADRQDRS